MKEKELVRAARKKDVQRVSSYTGIYYVPGTVRSTASAAYLVSLATV